MMHALLILQAVLLVYHQAMTWLDFFPFNNIHLYKPMERFVEAALHGLLFGISMLAVWFGWQNIQNGTLMFYMAIFGVGVLTWWVPYVFGPGGRWKVQYQKMFSEQLKFIPRSSRPVTPTMEVFVQHALILAVIVVFVWYRILSSRV